MEDMRDRLSRIGTSPLRNLNSSDGYLFSSHLQKAGGCGSPSRSPHVSRNIDVSLHRLRGRPPFRTQPPEARSWVDD
eukprot:7138424-Pyramimonas_sp.AAC.1